MSWVETELIGFAPDLPADTPGAILGGANLMPTARGGFAPHFTSTPAGTGNLDTISLSVAALYKSDGTERQYIGTAAKLWEYNGTTTLTDRSAFAYHASASQLWTFCQVGDLSIAANKGDFLQVSSGGAFASIGAAPVPKAAIVMNVGPPSSFQLMTLNYNDGTDNFVDGWFCSALSDHTNWNVNIATSCANGRLLEPSGPFTAGVPYRDGCIAFKANAMYRGTYALDTANGVVWAWERIASDIGCSGPDMVCLVHDVVYFADRNGIWVYDGSYPKKLPGAIHNFWANQITTSGVTPGQIKWDRQRDNLLISYFSPPSYASTPTWLTFNLVSQKWGPFTPISMSAVDADSIRHIIKASGVTSANIANCTYNTTTSPIANLVASGNGVAPISSIKLWAVGSSHQYVHMDRLAPIWMGGGSPVNYAPPSSTLVVLVGKTLFNAGATGVPVTSLDADLKQFDFSTSANYLFPNITFSVDSRGWEFARVGMSISKAGAAGKS